MSGFRPYFQGPAWLLGEPKKTTRPGRRCTQTCPWAETGGSENLSWPVIQSIEKNMGSKKPPKNYQKDSSQDALPKFFHWIFQPQCFRCLYISPREGQLPAKHPARLMVLSLIHGNRRRPKVTFPPARPRKSLGNSDFGWFCVSSLRRERWVYTWQLMVSKTSFIGGPG